MFCSNEFEEATQYYHQHHNNTRENVFFYTVYVNQSKTDDGVGGTALGVPGYQHMMFRRGMSMIPWMPGDGWAVRERSPVGVTNHELSHNYGDGFRFPDDMVWADEEEKLIVKDHAWEMVEDHLDWPS